MVVNIAWKNIWRNPLRSSVVLISIVLGLWAATFMFAYMFGIMDQRLQDVIGFEISHLQYHHPEFSKDYDPAFYIDDSEAIAAELSQEQMVKAFSARVVTHGMAASAANSYGGKILGIDPEQEQAVFQLATQLNKGEYLQATDRHKVIIGQKLADKLKVKLRSKIVLTFQDKERNITSAAFRIKGIYKSYNSSIEERNIYVDKNELAKLIGLENQVHEIAVLLKEAEEVDSFVAIKQKKYPAITIESWQEISPEMSLIINSMDQYMIIFLIIILLALSFGIVNTMLMAVLERVREIGVLMAIGMNQKRIFLMIFWETTMLITLAAPIGLLLAYGTITYFANSGLDISGLYKESYSAYGFQTIIYPSLEGIYYIRILIMVAITALLASIYPAYSALKLNPVKAIRKI